MRTEEENQSGQKEEFPTDRQTKLYLPNRLSSTRLCLPKAHEPFPQHRRPSNARFTRICQLPGGRTKGLRITLTEGTGGLWFKVTPTFSGGLSSPAEGTALGYVDFYIVNRRGNPVQVLLPGHLYEIRQNGYG